MRSSAVQVALDSFFGSLGSNGDLQRVASDRAFAKARDQLSWTGMQRLNSFVVNLADSMGLIPRWHGLRVVAADASDFMPSVLAYKPKLQPKAQPGLCQAQAPKDRSERRMLFEALSHLKPDDVLVLDRGYPAS